MDNEQAFMIAGEQLAEFLLETSEMFVQSLAERGVSQSYCNGARRVIAEFAHFCRDTEEAQPWSLWQQYLKMRPVLRADRPYTAAYLRRQHQCLSPLLQWYRAQTEAGEVRFGQLPEVQLARYWTWRTAVAADERKVVDKHLPCLRCYLQQLVAENREDPWSNFLPEYFEERRLQRRGVGYCHDVNERVEVVTRRHLIYLERMGYLPAQTARRAALVPCARRSRGPAERVRHFAAKIDPELPLALRRPLQQHLERLVEERDVGESRLYCRLRPTLMLCRHLVAQGVTSFAGLRPRHLDAVVASLLTAPPQDLLRRRRQVKAAHGHLRGFLQDLQQQGLVRRDLAQALVSPPCYRASEPPTVMSPVQVQALLDSVDRNSHAGRRLYAILQLLTTYGLRPVDVAELKLEALHWRTERLTLVQKKTGAPLSLPLLPPVAQALAAYLQKDRDLQVAHREVFLALRWPHRPLRSLAITALVTAALDRAGFAPLTARHLRVCVATHLLRQGEPFSVIQEVLGHRTTETLSRYARSDVALLRQVLPEAQR